MPGTQPQILLLRVWLEPGHSSPLRVRLLEVAPGAGPAEVPLAVVTTREAALALVGEWLDRVARTDGGVADEGSAGP